MDGPYNQNGGASIKKKLSKNLKAFPSASFLPSASLRPATSGHDARSRYRNEEGKDDDFEQRGMYL